VLVTELDDESPAAKAGMKLDDLVTAIDGKPVERFFPTLMNMSNTHQAGDKITVTITRGAEKKDIVAVLATGGRERLRGRVLRGRTQRPYGESIAGQRANVQDQQGPDGYQTGGVYKSTDGGESWTRINSLNPRPMYFSQIRVDPSDDKIIYVLGV